MMNQHTKFLGTNCVKNNKSNVTKTTVNCKLIVRQHYNLTGIGLRLVLTKNNNFPINPAPNKTKFSKYLQNVHTIFILTKYNNNVKDILRGNKIFKLIVFQEQNDKFKYCCVHIYFFLHNCIIRCTICIEPKHY